MIPSEKWTCVEVAVEDGHVRFTGAGKAERNHYIAVDHSKRWSDPDEKSRAEFWAELIYKYEYQPERIGFEVKVERRTPDDKADLVIYADDERRRPRNQHAVTKEKSRVPKPKKNSVAANDDGATVGYEAQLWQKQV